MAGTTKKDDFSERIEKLSGIICDTAQKLGTCPVVDFVADLANMVMFAEMNRKLIADRTDKLETEIDLLKKGISSDHIHDTD